MDDEQLADLVSTLRRRAGDMDSVEVKSARGGVPHVAETLCAFANMPGGGVLICGLDEEDAFRPVGLSDIASLERGIADQARSAVVPPPHCEFSDGHVDGLLVLVCQVHGLPLRDRPARYSGQPYLRQADGDYVMSEQEVALIELQKRLQPYEPDTQAVPGSSVADLDDDLVQQFVAAVRRGSRRLAAAMEDEVLRFTGVVTETGTLTLAGLYALGNYPQQFNPSLSITCAVHLPRTAGARTRDLVHLDGPISAMLDDAMAWVVRNTRTVMGYDQRGQGRDVTELPMQAVREIVANALVHRTLAPLMNSKRVEIRLLDDRLVVTSPGGLWGVGEAQLGRPGGKSAVNPRLYDLCRNARMADGSRIIEGEGGGIAEALSALREAGLRPPRFIDRGVSFTVLISRHTLLDEDDLGWLSTLPGGPALTSEQRAVLVGMRHGHEWTNGLVRRHFPPLDTIEARRLLKGLVDAGLSQQVGERGAATYRLAPELGGSPTPPPVVSEQLDLGVESRVAEVTKNARAVWQRLEQPATRIELADGLGLTLRQVQFTLDKLRDAGFVDMVGAGRRAAYRRRLE